MARNIRLGDTVQVISGADRGKQGKVIGVEGERVRVERVRMQKVHMKPGRRAMRAGGILEREAPLPVSNLMVVCPRCGTPTRVGHEILSSGKKARRCGREDCRQQMDA